MKDYLIVSDGTIDLDSDIIKSIDIRVIPMIYIMNGEEHLFDPSLQEFDDQAFYNDVNKGIPVSTSQNPPAVFTDFFMELSKECSKILYLCFSSGLSGNYNSAVLAAEEIMSKKTDLQIKVIDSLCASIGEGMYVREVCRKRDDGADFDEICSFAEEIKRDICHWFVVGNLEQLRRGGRLNAVEAKLGTILNIHPILTTDKDGKLKVSKKVRGMKKALNGLVEKFLKYARSGIAHRIIIAHAGCNELAEELKNNVMETGRIEECIIQKIGPVIGSHTGSPMCAITFLGIQEE